MIKDIISTKINKEHLTNYLKHSFKIYKKINLVPFIFSVGVIEEAVISDKIEEVTFNIKTTTNLLRNILSDYEDIKFNFINLDIQGTELKALKGLDKYLNNIDYIYIGINKDCNLIDEYLEKYNFIKMEYAFYIKNKKL